MVECGGIVVEMDWDRLCEDMVLIVKDLDDFISANYAMNMS